jgi:signal transduction histidine kinase
MPQLSPEKAAGHRTGNLYGSFAFGSVILSCFAGFFYTRNINGSEWMLVLTFALGMVYAVLGVLGGHCTEGRGPFAHFIYYLVSCAVVTAMLFASPIRGFFGIIVLPLLSQSIFEVRARYAALIGLYLFAASIAVIVIPYGWGAGREATVSYFTAYAFTIVFTIISKQALDARDREKKLREEIEAANAQLRSHAAQAEELATTRERNRVAREIHDGVGHYLTVVKTQLDAAALLIPTQPERARAAVETAAKLAHEALEDVRRSVGTLRTDGARPPLVEAVRQLAAHGEPAPTIAVEGMPRPLSPAIEHALFRAAQEGLTNIRKHARATAALVRLDFRTPARVVLELSDNGVGRQGTGSGFGLQGVRERIEIIGGTVDAANRLEGGFALRVEVPA